MIAVATPVETDRISFTNSPWSFLIPDARERLGVARLAVINDFVAQALAVLHLQPHEREQIGGGEPLPDRPVGVIGAGTGLGVAGLIQVGDASIVLATEGGHASLAPGTARERALLERMAARYGHVSKERAISGPGLLAIAQALAEVDGVATAADTPEAVTRAAHDGTCPSAARRWGCSARSWARPPAIWRSLTVPGAASTWRAESASAWEHLRPSAVPERFEAKGRMHRYLEPIPTFLITRGDTGLLGAARHRIPD